MSESPINIPPFLPRGSGPLVSICCASRNRPNHLEKALESLVVTATNPQQLEFIIKIDSDDTATQAAIQAIKARNSHIRITGLVSPRGRGYADMHQFVDAMAGAATGDWLFLFNDDARMKTAGWDGILAGLTLPNLWHFTPEDILVLTAQTNGQKDSNEFVLVRRELIRILGRSAPTPYVDSWLYYVLTPLQAIHRVNQIEVEHYRNTLLDQTRQDTNQFAGIDGFATLEGLEPTTGICADTLRLVNHLQTRMRTVTVENRPLVRGWYYWQGNKGERPRHLFVDDVAKTWPGGHWRLRVKA